MELMSHLFEEYLRSDEIKFVSEPSEDSDRNTDYMSAFETMSCDVVVKTHVDEDQRSIRIASSVGLRVPKERFGDVSRWIMSMNHTLIIGHFLVSPTSKEVELLVTAAYPETSPSRTCLRRLYETAIYCAAQNYEAILGTLHAPGQDAGPSAEIVDEVLARLMGSGSPDGEAPPDAPDDEPVKKTSRRRAKKSHDQ